MSTPQTMWTFPAHRQHHWQAYRPTDCEWCDVQLGRVSVVSRVGTDPHVTVAPHLARTGFVARTIWGALFLISLAAQLLIPMPIAAHLILGTVCLIAALATTKDN